MTAPPLHPYPTFKSSGVPWLGDVPKHWELVPNRALLTMKKEVVGDQANEYTLLSLTKRGIVARDLDTPEGKFPASFESYQIVEPGDLIFCLFDIDETPRTVGISDMAGMITGAYTRFICKSEQIARFIYLLYLHLDNGKLLKPLYSGLRKVITKSTFLSAKLAFPPLPEQHAIVRYLDYADRRIRRYVAAKERLIGLLEEEKQAVINRAVTRGIDPSVPLKPSGVEWLGDVPEHWEVRQLKTLCSMKSGGGITAESIETTGPYPVYGGNGLRGYGSRYTHDGAFALIGRQGALCGNVHIARGQFWASEHAVVATLQRGHVLDWFGAVLKVMNLNQYSIAAAQPGLAVERVLKLQLPVPPKREQKGIANHIERDSTAIDAAFNRARRQVELIQEYRTRLLADVVTGKLDVREAAARLPNETDDRDPIDESGRPAENIDGSVRVTNEAVGELATAGEVTV